ncbi:ATP-binding cassette domain-containing protein [Lonepinella sp. BR2930]|uniref:ATP-binding cassette domain-containing protein n=1 Tax=Lonepinella sp. BR2930 TaxID=3434554 RepID=UPI003F6E119E
MLTLSHLHFAILQDVIVQDFSLELQQGEIKTLFGPSSCGKTTVLRLVSGLDKPKSGKIINQFNKIGFLFQENRLLNNLTAVKNIEIFMPIPERQKIYALAAEIGLIPADLNKYPTELSGGMAKRVAFLRLLLSDCDLALLDEPFVGLDRDLRHKLISLLQERVQQKTLACLLVTHDRFEAVRLSHEILLLSAKGMLIQQRILLNEDFALRDTHYEENAVKQYLQGAVYYE